LEALIYLMRLAGSRGAFGNGYYLNLIFFSIVFDLAPKRETGGPKGRLFFSFGAV
jgi:hypothetical protein